jgi:hypothetical protein
MMSNGDRFEAAYNKIDRFLRKMLDRDKSTPFSSIVKETVNKNPTVRRYKEDLLEYGDLRNAIIHDKGMAPVVIADPREAAVVAIEQICNYLLRPKRLRSLQLLIPLRIFNVSDLLQEALSYMREKDFSQIIVFCAESYLIISAEGVTHWLEAATREDIIALSEVRLGDVQGFEPKDSCRYLKADETVDHAREIFANDLGKRVFSVLVTESGSAKQRPIKIITPWDFVHGKLR